MLEFKGKKFVTHSEAQQLVTFKLNNTAIMSLIKWYAHYDGWFKPKTQITDKINLAQSTLSEPIYAHGFFKYVSKHANTTPRIIIESLTFTEHTTKPELVGKTFFPIETKDVNNLAYCSLDELKAIADKHGFSLNSEILEKITAQQAQGNALPLSPIMPTSVSFNSSTQNSPNMANIIESQSKTIHSYKTAIEMYKQTQSDQSSVIENLSLKNNESIDVQKELLATASEYLEIAKQEKALREKIELENEQLKIALSTKKVEPDNNESRYTTTLAILNILVKEHCKLKHEGCVKSTRYGSPDKPIFNQYAKLIKNYNIEDKQGLGDRNTRNILKLSSKQELPTNLQEGSIEGILKSSEEELKNRKTQS
ncbi:hypothetical protein AAD001_17060 [Colwelliaceae bacterium 6471]